MNYSDRSTRVVFWTLAVLLGAHLVLLLVGLRRNFVVLDEAAHVPAGLAHWQTATFGLYRVNPPLGRMLAALPVLVADAKTDFDHMDLRPGVRSEWDIGNEFAKLNAGRYFDLVCLARLPGIAWSLLGAWLIFRWARKLYGPAAGCLSAAIWCIDPTVLAFAGVVTPDIPSAVAGLAATYAFWKYLKYPSWARASSAGVLLGIAQLTKFTMISLYGIWPLIALAHACFQRDSTGDRLVRGRVTFRHFAQGTLIFAISLNVLNLGYGFDRTGRLLGEFDFASRMFGGEPQVASSDDSLQNRFRDTWLGLLPVPVPADFLQGIDEQRRDFESHFPSYLAGQWRNRGWYHYYLYALAVKEPLGTWVLVLWAMTLAAIRHPASGRPTDEIALLLPSAIILVFVSSQDGFNHHMRYILPIFPFVAVATGKLSYFLIPRRWKSGGLILALLFWSAASSLSIFPHSMSYFNEVAGGPEHGHEHLLNSNIDWGQDLLHLKDWLESHPEARPLNLIYFHIFDPRLFLGVDYQLPPASFVESNGEEPPDQYGPHPGYYAISVNYRSGTSNALPDGHGSWRSFKTHDAFTYFKHFRPIARAGYTIYIYNITLDECNLVRQRMGLPIIVESGHRDLL